MIKQGRLITFRQEQALRLCHQDFYGLNQIEAAEQMGISPQALGRLLARIKKILPQYFPIFTKFEAKIYHYYMVDGWSVDEIAEYVEHGPHTIYRALQRVKSKGAYFTGSKGRVLSYDESMDAQVIQKF